MEPASKLIEQVTYTALLATNPVDNDTLLDSLREVTAHVNPSLPLESADRAKLLDVQQQLETYLVTREKLRLFTPESLRLQIEQHMQGRTGNKSRIQLAIVIAVACIVALCAALLLPLDNINIEQRAQVGGATAFSLVTVGAAWLFLTALPAFQSNLRKAFLIICMGVTLLGLSLLGQPIMEIFDLRQYPLTSVLYPLPILIAAIFFHIGNTMYVRIIGVKNRWTTAGPVLIASVVFSAITVLLPRPLTNEPALIHSGAAVIWAWIILTPIASAIILPMAVRRLPDLYKTSARFLFWAMFPIIAVCAYQYTVRVVAGPYMDGLVAYILFSLVLIMGLTLLTAGYIFNKVSRY